MGIKMNFFLNMLVVVVFWLSSMLAGYVIAKNQFKSIPCSITVSDATGNRHVFIGKGEVW